MLFRSPAAVSFHSFVNRILNFLPLLLSLGAALLVASLLLLAMNANPTDAITSMGQGAFGTENATAETLVKAIPILLVGIGICIAFRGGVVNIGGEGQMICGHRRTRSRDLQQLGAMMAGAAGEDRVVKTKEVTV